MFARSKTNAQKPLPENRTQNSLQNSGPDITAKEIESSGLPRLRIMLEVSHRYSPKPKIIAVLQEMLHVTA